MFETSVVLAQPGAKRGRFGLFTISLIAHTAVIVGAVAIGVASVDFPKVAPDEVSSAPDLMPLQVPPPIGTLNGGAAPPKPAPVEKQAPPLPTQITAPSTVPADIPVSDPQPSSGDPASTGPATGTGTEPGPVGVPWGVDGGLGDVNAPPAVVAAPQVEDKVYVISGDVVAPVSLHKVQPPYPSSLLRTRMRATVMVRCIIDKNGHVRDPQIVKGSLPPFNDSVINTVTQWRFKPGSYRGQAVETYLDLTVNFGVN